MKIWHLLHQYLPEKIGGTELYTQGVAAMQTQLGHAVTIITPSAEATHPPNTRQLSPLEAGEPRVWRFPFGRRSARQIFLATWRSHSSFERWFEDALAHSPPDIVHVEHLMGLPLGVIDLLNEAGVPFIMTLWDFWAMCANAQLYTNYDHTNCDGPDEKYVNCGRCILARAGLAASPALGRLVGPIAAHRLARIQPVLAGARYLIAPTKFVRRQFEQAHLIRDMNKVVVLPHGIQLPDGVDLTPVPSNSRLRVAYIGGLSAQKGVHVLVDAFNGLPEGVHLDLYGDETAFPDYVADLKRLATHPGISFRGRIEHEEVWDAFKQADLAAVPTLWYETFSFVVDEAMAVGTPVIASNIGVMPEKIREGVDGHLVTPGDAGHWRQILSRYVGRPERLAQLTAGIKPPITLLDHTKRVLELYEAD